MQLRVVSKEQGSPPEPAGSMSLSQHHSITRCGSCLGEAWDQQEAQTEEGFGEIISLTFPFCPQPGCRVPGRERG